MSEEVIRITTGARLHFGPLSFRPAVGRHFGGIGVMVRRPGWTIDVSTAPRDIVDVSEEISCFDTRREITSRVLQTLDRCRATSTPGCGARGCRITIHSIVPHHQGLGSGTQLALAVARGWNLQSGFGLGDPRDLAVRIGRGRRSAIGLWGFDMGGFLVDAGQQNPQQLGDLAVRASVPDRWRILLLTPAAENLIRGQQEEDWLALLPSMSDVQSAKLCRLVLTELLPALRSGDLPCFREALQSYGDQVGDFFSQVQDGRYTSKNTHELVDLLHQLGVTGVVQTSWGPTLCIWFDEESTARDCLRGLSGQFPTLQGRIVEPANEGAGVELLYPADAVTEAESPSTPGMAASQTVSASG